MSTGFIIAAVIALAGAVAAMTMRNLVHCALSLAVTFGGLAVVYLALDAQFIGFAQLLVYVGAVAILIVFAILLTSNSERDDSPWAKGWIWGMAAALVLFGFLGWCILSDPVLTAAPTDTPSPGLTVRRIGDQLMGRFLLPLEIIGLLLTAGLIGAVVLALRDKEEP
jgi:NADH-quinone oxidoreductase subunit J